jgi:cytochrome d ubiquinol oxidase subunit II
MINGVQPGPWPGFLMTSLSWLSLWGLAGAVLYPALVRASEPGLSLTAANASSSPLTLRVMFIIALVGLPVVIASTAFLYKVFKGRVNPEKGGYGTPLRAVDCPSSSVLCFLRGGL